MTAPATRTRRDVELLVGVQPLDEIHRERVAIVKENATLFARVETWKERRKAILSLVLVDLWRSYEPGGTRASEKRPAMDVLDAMAHVDTRYTTFLDRAEREIGEAELLRTRLRNMEETVNRDQRIIGLATAEARL